MTLVRNTNLEKRRFAMVEVFRCGLLCCFLLFCSVQSAASKTKTWTVLGHVVTMEGDPIEEVAVRLEIDSRAKGDRSMETDFQGNFETDIRLESGLRIKGTLIASKKGYLEGRETVELGVGDECSPVEIVLRKPEEDSSRITMEMLLAGLTLSLKADALKKLNEESARDELVRGCNELVEEGNYLAALALLGKSAEGAPGCIECRLLYTLALLSTGGWSSVMREIEQIGDSERPEPPIVMGSLQAWRGRPKEAAGSYMRALEADPEQALALQELGRAAVQQKNWEAADQYLSRSLRAGAGDAARLLRVPVLLELGDVQEAAREMDLYVEGREIRKLPQDGRVLYYTVQNRLALMTQGQVKSVVEQSMEELIETLPDLRGLVPTADQSLLEEILKKTGEAVDAFLRTMPNTASLERVQQELVGKDGKVKESLRHEFYYLVFSASKPGMGLREYRSTLDGQDVVMAPALRKGLMLTSGFTSASSVFHPDNWSGADFRYLGRQTVDGLETHVVAFAQKPETAKLVTRFVTDDGAAQILTHGIAWIDVNDSHVIRLNTFLLNPVPRVRLQKQTTEIRFQQVEFDAGSLKFWLPQEVRIMVDWRGRVLRNQHSYSDFKLFNVESKEERKPPSVPEPALSLSEPDDGGIDPTVVP